MTGCDTHGELLGGYVLGALSPEETERMRVHLGTCDACAAEYAALAGLPALLDRIEPADVPPPLPPPALEEAVLDTFARERGAYGGDRRGAAGDGRRPPDDEDHVRRPRRDRRQRDEEGRAPRSRGDRRQGVRGVPRRTLLRAAGGVVAVLVVVGVALAVLLPGGDEPYAHGTLAGATTAAGSFTVEQVPSGTRVYLKADKLDSDAYEVWCIRTDGRWISGGSFRSGSTGSAAATLTAAVEPGDYHEVVVTRGGGGERGPVVMRGDLVY